MKTFAQPGDVLLGISTSGRSLNVINAFQAARQQNLNCIALVGGGGGELLELANTAIRVPVSDPQRIQEVQLLVVHLLCELVEEQLLTVPQVSESQHPELNTPLATTPRQEDLSHTINNSQFAINNF